MATGTYNDELVNVRDRIRAALGDTGPTEFEISDAQYDAVIAKWDEWRLAAAELADQLASIYLTRVRSFSRSGGISVSWGDMAGELRQKSAAWRKSVSDEANAVSNGMTTVQLERDEYPHSEYRDLRRYRHGRF